MSEAGNNTTNTADLIGDDPRLEAWLADAPRVESSVVFQDRVMRALEARRPWHQSLRRFLFSAHTLRWHVAGLAGATALVVLAVGLGLGLRGLRPWVDDSAQTVKVRFVLHRPGATEVRLAGDFTGWQARVPLVRQADGSWRADVRLRPGEYEYAFVVNDKQWVQDPAAKRFRDDGFGGRNAVLSVSSARRAENEG